MAEDPQTYQRGAQTAVLGLVVQFVLSVAVALIGLWAGSPAIIAATWYFFGGIPLWIILFLIYNQHRLEREEALEAEQLARRDQASAAIFDEHADDLELARRRLALLEKWGLPVTALIVALYLIGVGGSMIYFNRYFLDQGIYDPDLTASAMRENTSTLLLMFFSAGLALVAFVVARYIAGMTKVRQWQMLRGGAGYLMGTCLVSALLFIASVIDAGAGYRQFLGLLALVIPGIMMLVGVEIALNFLLGVYRPRRPGEVIRPSFDSRMLGILTSPESLGRIIGETVNYQFGFEISRSWFYQLLGRAIAPLIAASIVTLLLFSCIVIVQPYEMAIITSRGKITGPPVGPGLHWKLPWPMGAAEKFSTGRVTDVSVGSAIAKTDPKTAILWTNSHTEGEEQYLIVPPSFTQGSNPAPGQATPSIRTTVPLAVPASAPAPGTGTQASPEIFLLAAEVLVQYQVDDVERYAGSAADVPTLLKALADRRITEYFAGHDMDALLTHGRIIAGQKLREDLQADVNDIPGPVGTSGSSKGLGIKILFVGLVGIHPPQASEVAASFHDQIGALQEKEGTIQDANKNATQVLTNVAGSPANALAIDANISRRQQIKAQIEALPASATQERAKLAAEMTELEAQIETFMAPALDVQDKPGAGADQVTANGLSGQAAQVIYDARAYRWQHAITEMAKALRFDAEDMAYRKAPDYYKMRQYLDTLVEGTTDARKYIITGNVSGLPPIVRIDLKDAANALEGITSKPK